MQAKNKLFKYHLCSVPKLLYMCVRTMSTCFGISGLV